MTTRQIQDLLHYLGYSVTPDGLDGPQTRAAVKAFQEDYGLAADGIAGRDTQKALKDSVAYDKFKPPDVPNSGTSPDGSPAWWADIKHFKRSEPYIGCSCGKCGGFPAEPSERLMRLADRVREHFDLPMVPTSTVRCEAHNVSVGGVASSKHLYGKAMDYRISGKTAAQILDYVLQQPEVNYAYAVNDRVVHMDVD